MRSALAFLGLAAAAAIPSWAGEVNVIVVVMDTVRADHCSLYGYARKTTPRLEEFAARGVTFENAEAQSDWTIPAHAALFTGRRPISTGILGHSYRLGASETTLAQLFQQRGLKTAAFKGVGLEHFGLMGGFGETRSFYGPARMGSLAQSMPPALQWLEQNKKKRFFLYIHGADAHTPFGCPQDWRVRFSSGGEAPVTDPSAGFPRQFRLGLDPARDWTIASPEQLEQARALRADTAMMPRLRDEYDGCLAYGDEQLAALSEAMTRLGLWKDTILVVTADHGEEFADHGGYGHYGRPLHEEITHVPLVIIAPGAAPGQRRAPPFEQIDLLPTVADFENWSLPAGVQGRSQRPVLEGRVLEDRLWYAQADTPAGQNEEPGTEALRLGRWKALRTGPRWELFDLTQDPGERRDLFAAQPDVFLRLAAQRLALEAR